MLLIGLMLGLFVLLVTAARASDVAPFPITQSPQVAAWQLAPQVSERSLQPRALVCGTGSAPCGTGCIPDSATCCGDNIGYCNSGNACYSTSALTRDICCAVGYPVCFFSYGTDGVLTTYASTEYTTFTRRCTHYLVDVFGSSTLDYIETASFPATITYTAWELYTWSFSSIYNSFSYSNAISCQKSATAIVRSARPSTPLVLVTPVATRSSTRISTVIPASTTPPSPGTMPSSILVPVQLPTTPSPPLVTPAAFSSQSSSTTSSTTPSFTAPVLVPTTPSTPSAVAATTATSMLIITAGTTSPTSLTNLVASVQSTTTTTVLSAGGGTGLAASAVRQVALTTWMLHCCAWVWIAVVILLL